jgi:hypothetical protein
MMLWTYMCSSHDIGDVEEERRNVGLVGRDERICMCTMKFYQMIGIYNVFQGTLFAAVVQLKMLHYNNW